MKAILITLLLCICSLVPIFAQPGLEGIVIETYYISDANDSSTPFFPLPSGAVTYRVYVDLAPNWGLQAVYGATNASTGQVDTLVIRSTQPFFNNEDKGTIFGYLIPTTSLDENTVLLDSWFSTGRAGNSSVGVLKPEDLNAGAPSFPNIDDLLQNNDPLAGFPISEADGIISGSTTATWTLAGSISAALGIFDDINLLGNEFLVADGALTNFTTPIQGPNATNKILIGQFTTAGEFSGQLNLQIRNSSTGIIQQWVAQSPEAGQFTSPQLTWKRDQPPVISISSPADSTRLLSGDNVVVVADAMDPDSAVHHVDFFFNGIPFYTDVTPPFQAAFTASDNGSITARVTGDLGVQVISDPIYIEVVPYRVQSVQEFCNLESTCIPIEVFGEGISGVNGFDMVLTYDLDKIIPTGVIYNRGDLNNTDFFDTDHTIDLLNHRMLISVFLNSNAPPGSTFSGTGDIICVEFLKRPGFTPEDTTSVWITSMQASKVAGGVVQYDSIPQGDFLSIRNTAFFGSVAFWADHSPLVYDQDHPTDYLITNIVGVDSSCDTINPIPVRPDLDGAFLYDLTYGYYIAFDRDIAPTTDVQSVINSFDAFLVRKLLTEDPVFVPDVYQVIAMDVNMDGVISAGDVSQINQRSLMAIDEFRQSSNYNADGSPKQDYKPSRDWVFVSRNTLLFDPAYRRSSTFPLDNGIGYSRYRVPQPPTCIWTEIDDQPQVCPEVGIETYTGILLGDVNGNFRYIPNDGKLK